VGGTRWRRDLAKNKQISLSIKLAELSNKREREDKYISSLSFRNVKKCTAPSPIEYWANIYIIRQREKERERGRERERAIQ